MIVWVSGTPFGTVLRNFNDVGLNLPIETSNANSQVAQLMGLCEVSAHRNGDAGTGVPHAAGRAEPGLAQSAG